MKKILGLFESGFLIISLLFYSGGLLALVLSGGFSQGDIKNHDTGLIRIVFILIYVITFFLLILRWKRIPYFTSRNILIWVLIGYTAASISWSVAPELTFRRLVALYGTTMFGLYLSSRYTIKQQLKILALTYGITIILGFVFVIVLPKYGLMGGGHTGAWRGIYIHKNLLGKNMVLSSLVFILLATNLKQNRIFWWIGFCGSVILLLFSTSTSSLVALLVLLALYLACQIFRLRLVIMLPLLLFILTIGVLINVWIINRADLFLSFLGKDATLTGRTELWQLTWQSIQEQYWLGYGYGTFWSVRNSEANIINSILNWIVPHSHNGLLELWANLGFLGVAIYLIGFGAMFIKAIIQISLSKQWELLWVVLFLAYTILANITEHTVLRENDIFWILYISTYFSVGLLPKKI